MATTTDILRRFDARDEGKGISAVAKALGLNPSTVHSWTTKNHIPRWWQKELLALAHDKGVALSPTDFPHKGKA
jgi:hypothetical protein